MKNYTPGSDSVSIGQCCHRGRNREPEGEHSQQVPEQQRGRVGASVGFPAWSPTSTLLLQAASQLKEIPVNALRVSSVDWLKAWKEQ